MSAEIESELLRLRDCDAEIRRAAAASLGRMRADQAVPCLLTLLRDKDVEVRVAAVRAMGDIGDAAAILPLLTILKSGHAKVCIEAAQALNRMGNEHSLPHRILAETSLTMEQRIHSLNELRKIDKGNFYVTVSYSIPDIRQFCSQASTSPDPAIAEGARSLLTYLDNTQTLLRASQRDDTTASQELLRAAGPGSAGQSDILLRASTNDSALK